MPKRPVFDSGVVGGRKVREDGPRDGCFAGGFGAIKDEVFTWGSRGLSSSIRNWLLGVERFPNLQWAETKTYMD